MNKDFQKKGSKFKTSRDVLQEKTIKKEFFWSKERYCNKKIILVFFIHVSLIDIPNIDVFCDLGWVAKLRIFWKLPIRKVVNYL